MTKINLQKVYSNIKAMAKIKGCRISDLEQDAGVSIGYLSRVSAKNMDSTNTAMIDCVIAASRLLSITTDMLLLSDISKASDDILKLIAFAEKLNLQTEKGLITWNQDTFESISSDIKTGKLSSHPLVIAREEFDPDRDEVYRVTSYESKFVPYATAKDSIFSANLPSKREYEENVLYLTKVSVHENGTYSLINSEAYELYIYRTGAEGRKTLEKVCFANEHKEQTLYETLAALYSSVGDSMKENRLDSSLRDLIDDFLDTDSQNIF